MSDLQAKFAITIVALGFFFSYAFPAMKEMKHNHDGVIQMVGHPYGAPNSNVPSAPAEAVSQTNQP